MKLEYAGRDYPVTVSGLDQYAVGSVRTLAKAIAAHYGVDLRQWLSTPWPVLAIVYSSICEAAEGEAAKNDADLSAALHPNSDATGVYSGEWPKATLDEAFPTFNNNDDDDDGA